MKMVFKIFKRDLKNIFTNSMAIILAVGIAVLPSLYAWFNIYANWDPYGKESTSNMQIAVVIEDKGYRYNDILINVGSEIEKNLKGNDTINWQFLTREEAVTGVESSKYYAAIVIPSGFSKSLTSIVSDSFKQPKITYYANEKKNAIATKITDKVVQTVQNEVNESFVTTVVNLINSLLGTVIEEAENSGDSTLYALNQQIKSAKKSVQGVQKTLDGFEEVMKITQNLNNALSDKNIKELLTNGNKAVESTEDVINITRASVSSITSSLDNTLSNASTTLNTTADSLDAAAKLTDDKATTELTKTVATITKLESNVSVCIDALNKINNSLPVKLDSIDKLVNKLTEINKEIGGIKSDITTALSNKNAVNAAKETASSLRKISSSLVNVTSDYKNNVKPALNTNINSLLTVLADISNLMKSMESDVPQMNVMVKTLNDSLNAGTDMITAVGELLDSCEGQLDSLSSKIEGLSDSDILNAVYNITSDNDELGKFIACPVQVDTEKVYGIDNYGSAMAPFYSTLAIWVGAIILVAIFNTKVKNKKELGKVGTVQEYFGRGLTFMFFSLVQGLIVCLGDLYFLKIQCFNPGKFIFATIVASLIFSVFIYSLVAAFGDIGKAVAVILLVVQLGGSGGTFPIDVTPSFFRSINPYLPFTFVINAMRECVCGTYGNDYQIDLLKLAAYIPVSLIIGLFFRFLFKKPVKFFNKRVEKTGLF